MVLPPDLVRSVTALKTAADTGNSVMDQIACAELLTSGGYDRHLRQMRRRYLKRRNALLSAFDALIERAEAKRVKVEPLAPCYADPRDAPAGLMLGYANLGEAKIAAGVQALGDAAT